MKLAKNKIMEKNNDNKINTIVAKKKIKNKK